MKFLSFSLFLSLLSSLGFGQGIRGTVKSTSGEALPFASVFVRNLGDGVPCNADGFFEMKLEAGTYDVFFQYLGYQSLLKTVTVSAGEWQDLSLVLEPQVYTLDMVEVQAGAEDPALTIMRKAIAKANYHRLQLQSYEMLVYLKGTGELTKAPFFMKKELEKDGVRLNEAYTSESVSRVKFSLPDKLEEQVISIRTNGDNQNTSPAPYIQTSFYNEKINEIISPLSRVAFQYYRFRFEGSFFDQEVLVNKIRVIPRSKGERVFDGYIYIIEGLWAIHSLDLKASILGFQLEAQQQYAPVESRVWMPLSHRYRFSGKFFGFEGAFHYLASTRDYQVVLNPDLIHTPEILDEQVEAIPADLKEQEAEPLSTVAQLNSEQPMTRKDFRKLINTYEKELREEQQEPEVIRERDYAIDSMAKKRELVYWDSIRPVPLTAKEIRGYQRDDSLAVVEAAKMSEVDSVAKKAKRKFRPLDVLVGGSYNLGAGASLGFEPSLSKASFNTVEGFKVGLAGFYRRRKEIPLADSINTYRKEFAIEPELRYGFRSRRFYGKSTLRWSSSNPTSRYSYGLEGGRYIDQFNEGEPINEQVNDLYSLLFRQNYMKLYEQSFGRIFWDHRVDHGFTYRVNFSYAQRRQLFNQSDYSLYNRGERIYTPNQPENVEAGNEAFHDHQIARLQLGVEWRPGLRYGIRNGRKYPISDRAPLIRLDFSKAIPQLTRQPDFAADFDHLRIGIEHDYTFGISGKFDFTISAGTFLNANRVYFPDFQHFGGNRTIFSNFGPASNFRFMDYYTYSTASSYLSGIFHYQFRKFLLTQLPMLRFSGVRENLFLNYLKTEHSPHYVEVGYSLDNLFRIFRVEFGAGFEDGRYLRGGVRLGVATFIQIQ